MDLAFMAQLSSRTSISGSQLSIPEFPSAISQFITLFFSYTEVQCMKSSFCFNFVSQYLINYIFAKVKYIYFNMSNSTKEPHTHTHTHTHTSPLHLVLPFSPKVLGPVTCQGPVCFSGCPLCKHTEGFPSHSSVYPSAPRKITRSPLLPPLPSLSLNI